MTLGGLYHTVFDFERSQQAYQDGFALWQRVEEEQRKVVLPPAPHALRMPWVKVTCLDLTATNWMPDAVIMCHLFSGLVEGTPDLDIVPDLARSWEILDNGRRYVFHLRSDARWSDGRPVTAHDFEFTWKYQLNPANASPNHEQMFDIKGARACYEGRAEPDDIGVHALDDLTLAVELEEPVGHFLQLLTFIGTFAIPRHAVQAHGTQWATAVNIITNGPFRLETWRPEERIVLVRNSDYHGRTTGNVSRVELTQFDTWLPHEWLRSYEADACDICGVDEEIIEQARRQHANEYVNPPIPTTSYVLFNTELPPFDDRRVRQAFIHAVDRATMTRVALRDVDSPATGGFVPPGLPGHSAGIGLQYDPERARQLLSEAGYPDGRGFPTIEASKSATAFSPETQYLQKQWHDVLGIHLQWTLVPRDEWYEQRLRPAAHLIVNAWAADYSDPHSFLNVAVHLYASRWRNADYEHLLEVAQHMTDQTERIKVYRSAEQILMREAAIMPLTYGRYSMVVKPWIKQYPISPLGDHYWKDVIIEPH